MQEPAPALAVGAKLCDRIDSAVEFRQKPQRALAVLGVITLGMIFIMLGHYRTWRYQLNGNTWNTTLAVEMALGSWLMSGVSEENVMNLLNRVGWHGDCFLVSVHNRTVYTSFRPRARDDLLLFRRLSVLTLVETVARRDPQFPNVEFAMCVEDCVVSQFLHHPARHLGTVYKLVPDPLPAFTMVKCSGSANIPFPVWDLADGTLSEWDALKDEIVRNREEKPWSKRRDQAVFRGGMRTCNLNASDEGLGGIPQQDPYNHGRWNACGRSRLMYKAATARYRHHFNVSITDGWGVPGIQQDSPQRLPMKDQEDVKYLIYAEGHCQWANRLRRMAFMGGVVLRQVAQCQEHFSMLMKPWVHYIPVDYNFNNLSAAMEWGVAHDGEARRIAKRMNQYAEAAITQAAVEDYAGALLRKYASLLQYTPKLRPDAVPFNVSQWAACLGWRRSCIP